jgi:hypothetical protein
VDIYDKNERETMTEKEYKTILHDFLKSPNWKVQKT